MTCIRDEQPGILPLAMLLLGAVALELPTVQAGPVVGKAGKKVEVETTARVGIPHARHGEEQLKQDVPTVYIQPATLARYDARQDFVFRGNLARTGVYHTAGLAELRGVRWKHDAGAQVRSSPVLADGVLYVGFGFIARDGGSRRDGGLLALDAETGEEKWVIPVSDGVESVPSVYEGTVFFGGNDGTFYAVEASTGDVLWRKLGTQADGAGKVSPTVSYGVVFTGLNGKMRGFDVKTGEEVWVSNADMPSDTRGSMALARDAAYYTGHHAWGRLYALDVSTGRVRWELPAKGLYNTPALAGNLVYFQDSSHLKARRTDTGEPVWEAYLDREVGVNEMRINTSPTVWRNLVVVGLDRGSVHALDSRTGEPRWTFTTGHSFRSSPALTPANELLYLGCNDGKLYALSAANGEKAWEFSTGGPVESSPWPADSVLYVGSDDGYVYAIQ